MAEKDMYGQTRTSGYSTSVAGSGQLSVHGWMAVSRLAEIHGVAVGEIGASKLTGVAAGEFEKLGAVMFSLALKRRIFYGVATFAIGILILLSALYADGKFSEEYEKDVLMWMFLCTCVYMLTHLLSHILWDLAAYRSGPVVGATTFLKTTFGYGRIFLSDLVHHATSFLFIVGFAMATAKIAMDVGDSMPWWSISMFFFLPLCGVATYLWVTAALRQAVGVGGYGGGKQSA
jgi:hypothetical protein